MYPILLLPGSRRQEIDLLLPAILAGARRILEERPDAVFFLPVAQNMDAAAMARRAAEAGVEVRFTHDHIYDLMALSAFALATSGTVVLEAALMGLPVITLYRLSPLSYAIGRLLIDVPYFSLPNILLGEMAQPELLQDEVNPERILSEARRFWQEPAHREEVRRRLATAVERLGPPGAAARAAGLILQAAERLGAPGGSADGRS